MLLPMLDILHCPNLLPVLNPPILIFNLFRVGAVFDEVVELFE